MAAQAVKGTSQELAGDELVEPGGDDANLHFARDQAAFKCFHVVFLHFYPQGFSIVQNVAHLLLLGTQVEDVVALAGIWMGTRSLMAMPKSESW